MQAQLERMLDDYDRGRLSRRRLISYATGLAAAMVAAPRVSAQDEDTGGEGETGDSTFAGTDLNHIALRVTDIARSRAFYERHLGLEMTSQSRRSCFMRCGETNFVALFLAEEPGLDHYCYSIKEYDAATAVEKLKAAGLDPRRSGNRVYFDDPDGIEVQVAAKDHTA